MNFNRYIKLVFPSGLLVAFFLLQLCFGANNDDRHNSNAGANQSFIHLDIRSKPVSLHHFQNIPVANEFTQLRHKRALAANIYIHQPVIVFVPFIYTSIPYQEFYLADISEMNSRHLSLRGPPAIC